GRVILGRDLVFAGNRRQPCHESLLFVGASQSSGEHKSRFPPREAPAVAARPWRADNRPNFSRTGGCGMEAVVASFLAVIGLALGAVAAWLLRGRDVAAERERAARAESAHAALADALQEERAARAAAEATMAAERQAHQDKL